MCSLTTLILMILATQSTEYPQKCPEVSQTSLRQKGICKFNATYTCLQDTETNSIVEFCKNGTLEHAPPGQKYVWTNGFRNIACNEDRFQPYALFENESSTCVYRKSKCPEEGQLVYDDISTEKDRSCQCDSTKGYKFVSVPNTVIYCMPTEEDCMCYFDLASEYNTFNGKQINQSTPVIYNSDTEKTGNISNNYGGKLTERSLQSNNILLPVGIFVLLIFSLGVYFIYQLVECCDEFDSPDTINDVEMGEKSPKTSVVDKTTTERYIKADTLYYECEYCLDKTENKTANTFCKDCFKYMCEKCRKLHDKFKNRHTVTDSCKVNKSVMKENIFCKSHDKRFKCFCLDCECLTCSKCVFSDHKEHKYSEIADKAALEREDLKKRRDNLKSILSTLSNKIEQMKSETLPSIKKEAEDFTAALKDEGSHFKAIVNEVKEKSLTRANDQRVMEEERVNGDLSTMQERYDECQSEIAKIDQLLNEDHDLSFCVQRKDLKENVMEEIPEIREQRKLEQFDAKKFADEVIEKIYNECSSRVNLKGGDQFRNNEECLLALCNPNRPVEIARMFDHMYDKPRTESMLALEELGIPKDQSVHILLKVITDSYEECARIFEEQGRHLKSAVMVSDINEDGDQSEFNPSIQADGEEIIQSILDFRWKINNSNIGSIQKKVMQHIKEKRNINDNHLTACKPFVDNCIKNVWKMQINDPPVHISWELEHGSKIDANVLQTYAKEGNGDYVDYIVWPVLYLHKDGLVLNKGVVQAMQQSPATVV